MSTCNRLDLQTLGSISTDNALKSPRSLPRKTILAEDQDSSHLIEVEGPK